LAAWQLGSLAAWQLGSLAAWQLGKLADMRDLGFVMEDSLLETLSE
jgi:hypothetical protein